MKFIQSKVYLYAQYYNSTRADTQQMRCDMTLGNSMATLNSVGTISKRIFCYICPSNTQWQLKFNYLLFHCVIYLDIFLLLDKIRMPTLCIDSS